jgi:hypothetical protein
MENRLDLIQTKRKVSCLQSDRTVKDLCDAIDRGMLKVEADFQRKYVWENDTKLKSRLIESVFLNVPIPAIYTAEEDDFTEVVIDGQQRLRTFHEFLNDIFILRGLEVLPELNNKNYKSLGRISQALQYKVDTFPLRVIKISKDSDPDVRFDIFERLNRGSVKLNDQELRNCVYRGSFNDLLKEIAKNNKDYQLLLGDKQYNRFQDIELALRFLAIYIKSYHTYKSPMKHFLNAFMKEYRNAVPEQLDEFRLIFNKTVHLIKSLIGQKTFYFFNTENGQSGKFENNFNKGLFDILTYSFAQYDESRIMAHKDTIKEELFFRMVHDDRFRDAITGTGTDNTKKFLLKMEIWQKAVKRITESSFSEGKAFSQDIKQKLFEKNNKCAICGLIIDYLYDAEIDNVEGYWRGKKNIPENSKLIHRYCSRNREWENIIKEFESDFEGSEMWNKLAKVEKLIRECINLNLLRNGKDYWGNRFIPENIYLKVNERIEQDIVKTPYKEKELSLPQNKLTFCDIRDYMKIIKFNWSNMFDGIFMSKQELEKHFDNLAEFRNALNHLRELDLVTKKGGEAAIEWIQKAIDYSVV